MDLRLIRLGGVDPAAVISLMNAPALRRQRT